MKFNMSYVRFGVAALIVMVLGGLAGWYLFVSKQITATETQDSARGFGENVSFGGGVSSGISNLVGGVIGTILGGNDGEAGEGRSPELWHITRTPVAGLGFVATSSKLYFAERASGNILTADPSATQIERLTNTLFPKIIEAFFAADGSVILRSIGDEGEVTTYAARIATSSSPAAGDTPNKLEGVYLPENIISIAPRSAPNELFFVLGENTGAAGIASDWLGGSQKRLFTSSLSDWIALRTNDGSRYVVQKPSDDVAGYAYRVGQDGSFTRLLPPQPGLMVLPRTDSTALLYSTSAGGSVSLYARTSEDSTDTRLPIRTTADKCVWAPDSRLIAYCAVPQTPPSGTYLRDRFDGSRHTVDAWWRVDVSSNSAEQIYAPSLSTPIDVEMPQINAAGTHLGFMNASDKTLWMLTIPN